MIPDKKTIETMDRKQLNEVLHTLALHLCSSTSTQEQLEQIKNLLVVNGVLEYDILAE